MQRAFVLAVGLLLAFAAATTACGVASFPHASDLECNFCQFVVHGVESLVTANRTEAAIEKALDDVCGLLPASLSPMCDTLVNTYTPQLLQMLVNRYSPEEVCTGIGACKPSAPAVQVSEPVLCEACEFVVGGVEKIIGNDKTQQNIEDALQLVCYFAPKSLEAECQGIVTTFTPALIEFILANYPASVVCPKIGVCPSFDDLSAEMYGEMIESPPEFSSNLVSGGLECTICTFVLQELEQLLASNWTEAKIEAALDNVCTKFGFLANLCESFVNTYTPTIISALENKVPPSKVCDTIKACTSDEEEIPGSTVLSPVPEEALHDSVICGICELVLTEAERWIAGNWSEDKIEEGLDDLCSKLGKFSSACDAFVAANVPVIIDYIEQKVPANEICVLVKACDKPEDSFAATATVVLAADPFEVVESSALGCEMCEVVTAGIEFLIGQNSSEAAIVAAVDKVCTILPSAMQGLCTTLINTYGPQIIQGFLNKETPTVICQQIKLCTSSPTVLVQAVGSSKLECQLCTFVIGEGEKILAKNSTQQDVENALDSVCSKMGSFAPLCESFVDEVVPLAAYEISAYVTPALVCQTAKMCPKTATILELLYGDSIACPICKYVLGFIDSELSKQSTEQDIVNMVEKVCSLTPQPLQGICDSFISMYGPALINALVKDLDPTTICAEIHACSSSAAGIWSF